MPGCPAVKRVSPHRGWAAGTHSLAQTSTVFGADMHDPKRVLQRLARGTWNDNSHEATQNLMQSRRRLLSFWLVNSRSLHVAVATRFCKSRHFTVVSEKSPRHKHKIGTSPLPKPWAKIPPSLKRGILWTQVLLQKEHIFSQAPMKLAQAFPAPESRTRILRTRGFFWVVGSRFAVWRSLWVWFLPLDDGQEEKSSFHGRCHFGTWEVKSGHSKVVLFAAVVVSQRTPWGGGKKRGAENLTNDTPPKRGFWTPLARYVFHPPQVSILCFSCTKIHDRAEQKLFWGGPKLFGRVRSLARFPSPIRFAPPHITAQVSCAV